MSDGKNPDKIAAGTIIFIIVAIIFLFINIWAIVAILLNVHRLSWIAIIAAIIFLFIFPPISLVIVYALREPEEQNEIYY